MHRDAELCYKAISGRDARFDGVFYVGVTSTGIYCRPSCPATTPQAKHCRFFPSAAAAQLGGFRACKRCRPDAVPGSPEWQVRSDVAARAVRLIADGVVDREGVTGLALRLGYSERHLTRVLNEQLGAPPLALARAQRAQTARILIETTDMRLADVAFAAGFASIRQFNDTVREVYASTPSDLRKSSRHTVTVPGTVRVRLACRAPFHGHALLEFFGARIIAGLEAYDGTTYARTLRLPHGPGVVRLTAGDQHVDATFRLHDVQDLAPAVARMRRLLDLDADPLAVAAVLRRDPAMRRAVRFDPGLRVPGSVDGVEMAVRAVVGQQVSIAGASTIVGRIVDRCGEPLPFDDPDLRVVFPDAADIAKADFDGIGMPGARVRAVQTLAAAIACGDIALDGGSDRAATRAALLVLPGIGPWTADCLSMRALGDPDVFLAGDLGVRKGAALLGIDSAPKPLAAYAARWGPWRSYAVMHLWSTLVRSLSEGKQ
ncbi:MAG TPA: AlkA N-terminal domain-containing protein [Acidimicrobiia bacterium]|jgi:AraC family transcriptional regulator of adaptative response / DNA-3-methyladenine glycosylase II